MWIIIILVVVAVLAFAFKGRNETTPSTTQNPHHTNKQASIDPNAYNMSWPKPCPDNLWDTLDYFVRLAEVQSSLSTDTTVVSLTLHMKNYYNNRRGQFTLDYFDFESAQRVYGKRIPYLQDEFGSYDGHGYEVYDPTSTILKFTPNKVFEIVQEEAPHATLGNVYNAEKEGVIMISFVFPSRWSS